MLPMNSIPANFHIYDANHDAVESELREPLGKAFAELNQCDPIYTQIIIDLSQSSPRLTKSQSKFALETILATAIVERDLPMLKLITLESQRNKEITKRTTLGAEAGFSKGSNEKEVENILRQWIDTFRNTYTQAKGKDHMDDFFKVFSNGDPCLNGRYISLMKFAAKEEGIESDAFTDASPEQYRQAYEYSLLMAEYRENNHIESDESPPLPILIGYLKTLPDYESKHKPCIESGVLKTLYPLAKEMDSG